MRLMVSLATAQSFAVQRRGYSIAEVEVATTLSRATLYRMIAAGKLKTVKRGARRIVPTEEVERLMSESG